MTKRKLLVGIVTWLGMLTVTQVAWGADALKSDDFEAVWDRMNGVMETYQTHALQPVVAQQFWLATARSFFQLKGRIVPESLRAEVETLKLGSEVKPWLASKWKASEMNAFQPPEDDTVENVVARAVVSSIVPNANYVSAKSNRVNKQLAENQYVGIGIRVRWQDEKALIDLPFPGGAAYIAGARIGDFIMEVDGVSMENLTLAKVIDVLRGREGSKVTVVVENLDGSKPRTLPMVRTVIPIPSVTGVKQMENGTWQFVKEGQSGPVLANMNVAQIVGSTSAELKKAANDSLDKGAEGIVLNLSGLVDGDLHQLQMVADALTGEGEFGTLYSQESAGQKLRTSEHTELQGIPIAVLSPKQNVSGPVLAVLARLKKRANTLVIGKPIEGSLTCTKAVDLPGQDGAISNLPFAMLIPSGLEIGQSRVTDISGQEILSLNRVVQFQPEKLVNDGADPYMMALKWLTEQIESKSGHPGK